MYFNLESCDLLGVPISLKLNGKAKIGTKVGGFFSILLTLLSFSYFGWLYYLNFFQGHPIYDDYIAVYYLNPESPTTYDISTE